MILQTISLKKWFKEIGAAYFPKIRTFRHLKAIFMSSRMDFHEAIIRTTFRKYFHRDIDLENPQTLSEKLNWLKLNNKDPLLNIVADKYAVREYVESKGLKHLLTKVIGVYENVEDINFESLPPTFALKATHGSGWNLIQNKGKKLSKSHMVSRIKRWLRTDMSFEKGELAYQAIKPRIIIEELLDNNSKELPDYKFFCFAGQVMFLKYIEGRFGKLTSVYLDTNWVELPFRDKKQARFPQLPKAPTNLVEMVEAARILSQDFPFARVDFYDIQGKTFFGEITLYPEGGFVTLHPEKYDLKYGKLIDLTHKIKA